MDRGMSLPPGEPEGRCPGDRAAAHFSTGGEADFEQNAHELIGL
jgi:hypothetical protein